jgi:hypothetical protein
VTQGGRAGNGPAPGHLSFAGEDRMEKKSIDLASMSGAPIVINLGKKSRKKIKKLKKGEGSMVAEVNDAVEQVRARLPESEKNKDIVPIVMFCERKITKKVKFPFSPLSMMK